MSEPREGTLVIMPSGRWAIALPGETPLEITSGDQFYIEVPASGSMAMTRMEFAHIKGRGQYYSVDGHKLKTGLRVSFVGRGFLG